MNVNFPDNASLNSDWAFTQHGSYDKYVLKFVDDLSKDPVAQSYGLGNVPYPGVTISPNTVAPTKKQINDESAVIDAGKIAVTTMQVGFEANPIQQLVTRLKLRGLNH